MGSVFDQIGQTLSPTVLALAGTSESNGAREKEVVPRDGLPETVDRRVHARGTEREAPIESGGAGVVLGASEDQQRHSQQHPQGRRGVAVSAVDIQSENAAPRYSTVVSRGVGHGQEGHQHSQVRAGQRQGQVLGAPK